MEDLKLYRGYILLVIAALFADESMKLFEDTITAPELADARILIFLNKIDLVTQTEVNARQELFLSTNRSILKDRVYHIQHCCATSGQGLLEGFEWLVATLRSGTTSPVKQAPEPPEKDK